MISDNPTNAPLNWFTLFVYAPRNDAVTQIAVKSPNSLYIRFYTSSWSAWQRLALNSNFSSQTFSAYGLTIKASKLNELGIISIQGTTTGAIAQWTSVANLNTELQPSVVNTLFTGASFRANTNGAINATEAIASGTAINGYCIYVI